MKLCWLRSSSEIRVLSPRIEPTDRSLEGSIASTASRFPAAIARVSNASMKVDLPIPRRTRDTEPHGLARVRQQRLEQVLGRVALFLSRRFDEGDRRSQRPSVAREDEHELDALGGALDRAAEAAGAPLDVEAEREPVEMVEDLRTAAMRR